MKAHSKKQNSLYLDPRDYFNEYFGISTFYVENVIKYEHKNE